MTATKKKKERQKKKKEKSSKIAVVSGQDQNRDVCSGLIQKKMV